LKQYSVIDGNSISLLRQNSIACAALPLCGLAFAEAERYLPSLVDKIEVLLAECNLLETPISIRMTGCPNGCGRAPLAEIGLIGKAPGVYNLYLGASFTGNRLNKLYKETLNEDQILAELSPILKDYSINRLDNEYFGDFVLRSNYLHPNATEGI
jgi:sulfite reductase (NADPH) hemoprotein beta-component